MIVPAAAQVRYSSRPDNGRFQLELPNRKLIEFLEKHEIKYIDLLPAMKIHPKKSGFYYMRDIHWTAKGHCFAAESRAAEVWPFVEQRSEGQAAAAIEDGRGLSVVRSYDSSQWNSTIGDSDVAR